MPRNKPHQKISLTKTKKKKGLEVKNNIIDEVRKCVDKYENIFIFSFENVTNKYMNEIRLYWRAKGRFFLCKKKVMSLGLGRTPAEEIAENLHLVSDRLVGNRALFFTNASKKEVLEYFDNHHLSHFAIAGNIAPETFSIPEGPLPQFLYSLEPYLRKLGLPTQMKKGVITMYESYTVCKKGSVLSPEQAKILKLFGQKMGKFHLTMEFMWSKDGSFDDFGRTEDVKFTKKPKGQRHTKKTKEKENEVNENEVDENEVDENEVDENKVDDADQESEEEHSENNSDMDSEDNFEDAPDEMEE